MKPDSQALDKGFALLEAGSITDAVEAFRLAAESGIAEGCIQLARIEIDRGNDQGAGDWMSRAEALAEQGDAAANLSCSLAYQLGYGEDDLDVQEGKARHFLRKSAELGHPVAQTMLAQQLLWGLNGEVQDEEEYEVWISRAISQGLDEAVINHVKNRLLMKRVIEPALMTKLKELATRSGEAKKLLKKTAPRSE